MLVNWQLINQIASEPLLTWANTQALSLELFNGSPTKRKEKWWGKGVKLLNYGNSWQIYETDPIASVPILQELRDRFYPQANSVLLYYYPQGVGIGDHTDKREQCEKVGKPKLKNEKTANERKKASLSEKHS